jgi:hypothetical protein
MHFNFQNEVRRRFEFLEREHGFRNTGLSGKGGHWEETEIYTTPKVQIEVFRERSPQEVGVRFKDLEGQDESTWYFATYLTLVDRTRARWIGGSVAENENEVGELLDLYAEALRSRGTAILNGETKEFARFREALRTGKGLEPLEPPLRFSVK